MLAVQLMKPTAAAAAELVRNEDGSAQNDGRYATVPKPMSVNTTMSSAIECGAKNHALNATQRSIVERQNASAARACDRSSSQAAAFR